MTTQIATYLKLIGGCLMVSPLALAFFALDVALGVALLYTIALYVPLLFIAILMINYLECGSVFHFYPNNRRWKENRIRELQSEIDVLVDSL